MQLAANLTWLYAHLPLAERFDAAARDGFEAIEVLLPYDQTPAWYANAARQAGLRWALFNTPIGDGAGQLGWAAVPGAQAQFDAAFARALAVAETTACRNIHLMAGHVGAHDRAACHATLLANLERALRSAQAHGLTLCLEALNRTDMPGYLYHLPEQALAIVQHFDTPSLRLQFDFYHCVKEGLDPSTEIQRAAGHIGHAQIAGSPARDEPDLAQHGLSEGLALLYASGYTGFLGCEYRPRGLPAAGLGWAAPARAQGWIA